MYTMICWAWIIAGGILEPMWVIAMKKSNNFKNIPWAIAAIILILASPFCLSMAMKEMPVGTAYAIWTGMGSIFTVIAGMILYKERVERLKILFIMLIIIGVVGLSISEGI